MSDKVEIEFQKWLKKQEPDMREDLCSWSAFIGWQAAIESATVRLPEPHQDEWKELNLSTDEVVKALGDAGVKYVLPDTFVRY